MNPCRGCNKPLDAATPADGKPAIPKEGDISVCRYCCEVSMFDAQLNLVPVDVSTLDEEMRAEILKAKRIVAKAAKFSN